MPRLLHTASPIIPFIFALIAFVFALLSITSPEWSTQDAFDPSLDMIEWVEPLYSRSRSPFRICEASRADTTSANDSTVTSTYTISCQKYEAFGVGKTSCESVHALQSYTPARTGDYRLCQQIHKSGNLIITSTTFIGLGFTLILLLTLLSLQPIKSSSSTSHTANGETTTHAAPPSQKRKSSITPYFNLVVITSLSIGAITALLSQFYGILAFVQSQPPNGAWASGRGNVIQGNQEISYGPWVEGVVLKAYLTCAWVFAAFAAGSAGAVWRLPRWEKL